MWEYGIFLYKFTHTVSCVFTVHVRGERQLQTRSKIYLLLFVQIK